MTQGWPSRLQGRETGARGLPLGAPPAAAAGTLVLDETTHSIRVPGGLLAHIPAGTHYVDLGGVQAASLQDFGGRADFWGGITKLYASRCGLTHLDGIGSLTTVQYLYLDLNRLGAAELRRLCDDLPPGQLRALDLSGNPGLDDAGLLADLRASGLLRNCEFLNGQRLLERSPP
jgi:hypothetical protein